MDIDTIVNRVNNALNECLGDIYSDLDIKSGDIDPMTNLEWNDICSRVAVLFEELIKFNS